MSSPSVNSDSLLQHRSFVAFWIARASSSFGFQMLSIVVSWQIYSITGRAFDLGLIGLVQFLPSVLLALVAGHVAGQFDRRRVVLLGQIAEWVAIAALAYLTLTHHVNEVVILSLIFIFPPPKQWKRRRCSRCSLRWCRRICWRVRWRLTVSPARRQRWSARRSAVSCMLQAPVWPTRRVRRCICSPS